MKKIRVNMLSKADSTPGQGVGSAYLEQVKLVREGASDVFDVMVNSHKASDIIHVHSINFGHYFHMRFSKSVSVCYVHFLPETLDGSIKLPKPIFNIFKKYVISFYRHADYLVVVNPIFIKPLEKYGIDKSKIKYIPNYVSKKDFYKLDIKQVSKKRKELDLKENDFVVIGVGQVQTRKGVLDFIDVARKMPDVKFVWAGGFSFGKITDGYEELKKACDNAPSNLKFLGIVPREEMNSLYNVADVLFMPSYNELFPMSILEAVNSAKPLLLRDLDLYEDILFKKYVKAVDNQGFIDSLKKLRTDKKFYEKSSLESKEISEFYSKEHVLKQWIDFYTEIYKKANKN